MTPERWRQIEQVFLSALELEPGRRDAFLRHKCSGDEDLLHEVQSLLAQQSVGMLDFPALEAAARAIAVEKVTHLSSDLVGQTLQHYRIIEKIGAGGMGVVYHAKDTHLDRSVAIKVLPADTVTDAERKRRFIHEAKSASALNHPNIIHIYDIDCADGVDFIAMEFVAGRTIDQLIGHKGLPLREALNYAIQIADAVATAHAAGIVHRDLKPANLMVTGTGLVKVVDFGLAKLMERIRDAGCVTTQTPVVTEQGVIVGTAAYMSPEQAEGKKVDARSDIFSFGSVLYEMLAGRRAFQRDSKVETLSAILHQEPEPVEGIPVRLDEIVRRCLRKDLERRSQHMGDVKIALEEMKEHLEANTSPSRLSILARVRRAWRTSLPDSHFRSAIPRRWISSAHPGLRFAGVALILLLVAILSVLYWQARPVAGFDSLAVLPFINSSRDPSADYLSEGFTESLITDLARIPQLKVKSRDAVFRYRNQERDPVVLGRELGVRALVQGRILQREERFTLTVELIDAGDASLLWRDELNRATSDLLAVQQEVLHSISKRLQSQISGAEQPLTPKPQTDNNDAFRLYLRGRYWWNRRTEDALQRSVEFFDQAIEKDPGYARAWAGLADSHMMLAAYGVRPPWDAFPRAKAAAGQALQIDELLAEAHASLGRVKTEYEWDWAGGEREYRRAIELNPDYATAYYWYALHLSVMGRHEEAIAQGRRAAEADPLSLTYSAGLGFFLLHAHRYDEAQDRLRSFVQLNPGNNWGHIGLGSVALLKGQYGEAPVEFETAVGLSKGGVLDRTYLAHAYAITGRTKEALQVLEHLEGLRDRYVAPDLLAFIHTGLGNKDRAFELLEKAYSEKAIHSWFFPDPRFDPLRADSRFKKLRERMGL